MTDNVELRQRYVRILEGLLAIFGPLFDEDDGPIRRRGPGDYSPGGPPPQPWRKLGAQIMGEALVRAAQMKVAGQMAGNEALVGTAKGRIMALLDDDWCPTYPHVIKVPPYPPIGIEPPPRPNWNDFEILVSTVVGQHEALPDGAVKAELGSILKEIAGPG